MAVIVVCEDDLMIQKLFRVALRPTPHELHLATDGVEGLDVIRRIKPDLVFTDVAMPRMTGTKLVDAMKLSPELASIPVVFVTASVQRHQLEEGYRHGIAGHLAKPFGPAELLETVTRFLPVGAA
jgi:CheY-like chemotaxis protein